MGDDDTRTIPKLKGADNYPNWSFLIRMLLTDKDLEEYLTINPTLFKDPEKVKASHKCYAKVVMFIDEQVTNALPANCRDFDIFILSNHLLQTYSSAAPSRTAAIFSTLISTKVQSGEDPAGAMATMQSAHQQLASAGVQLNADCTLALIMTALPAEGWEVVKSTLWHQKDLTSIAVQNAVRQEYEMRKVDQAGQAMFSKGKPTQSFAPPKPAQAWAERKRPAGATVWCSLHKATSHPDHLCRT